MNTYLGLVVVPLFVLCALCTFCVSGDTKESCVPGTMGYWDPYIYMVDYPAKITYYPGQSVKTKVYVKYNGNKPTTCELYYRIVDPDGYSTTADKKTIPLEGSGTISTKLWWRVPNNPKIGSYGIVVYLRPYSTRSNYNCFNVGTR